MTDAAVAIGQGGRVSLLARDTGALLWQVDLSGFASACAGERVSVSANGDVVIAGCAGHVFALATATGALLWHREIRTRGVPATDVAIDG
ncbi:MAG: PQQ-binding-like beta-propeller repeat protein [Hyphomicrobiales bacterium]